MSNFIEDRWALMNGAQNRAIDAIKAIVAEWNNDASLQCLTIVRQRSR